jgi:Flp pilus assembly CpaE family ATPase
MNDTKWTISRILRNGSAALKEIVRLRAAVDKLTDLLRDVSWNPKTQDERASGRTVRLILRALIAISEGWDVCIIAATTHHARDIHDRVVRQANLMGIPMRGIRILHGSPETPRTGFHGVTLVDHFAIEQIETEVASVPERAE